MTNQADTVTVFDLAREARSNPGCRTYGFWLAIGIVLVGLLDVVSTDIALTHGGAYEANPLIRSLMTSLGVFWVAPKMILHGALGYMVIWYPNRITLAVMTVVAGLVALAAANNFYIYAEAVGAL